MSRRPAASDQHSGTLAAYLREIARLPRLTIDEERDLGRRIQADRDPAALSRLVESNLRFVVSYAKRYRRDGVPLLDLIHEGNLGLMEAARRFDPARNVKFITYAVWWVRQSMMHVLSDHARAFSFPPKLFAALGSAVHDVSLSEPADQRDSWSLSDRLVQDLVPAPDDLLARKSAHQDVDHAIERLDRREREVVRLRFGFEDEEPWTLQAIGHRLNLSRERVRQIEVRAKAKLRGSLRLRSHLN